MFDYKVRLKNHMTGFTVVELLIVIVVIGILAALVLNTFVSARERAQAVAIADGFKKIDSSLKMYAVAEGLTEWWDDEDMKGPDGESSIAYMIEATELSKYLSEPPHVIGFDDTFYDYDNDLDEYTECGANSWGVNIQTPFSDIKVAQRVDDILDDGNLNCGKVRMDEDGELVYNIGRNSSDI